MMDTFQFSHRHLDIYQAQDDSSSFAEHAAIAYEWDERVCDSARGSYEHVMNKNFRRGRNTRISHRAQRVMWLKNASAKKFGSNQLLQL